jgi:phosphoribosylaminoimidazolecarboxamide formyltransferase/IMP cyclohydrolase
LPTAIENIDIGGPSLVRAAAKNSQFVTIATSPDQYDDLIRELRESAGCTSLQSRRRLMAEAFAHTAEYDRTIAAWLARSIAAETADDAKSKVDLPEILNLQLRRHQMLRYGENPAQAAALYEIEGEAGTKLSDARQLHGKELSFNNWLDLNAALGMVSSFAAPACVVLKHNNPCGAAAHGELADIVQRAMAGDPLSAFGSILALNRPIDEATAVFLAEGPFFIECILAPGFLPEALHILTTRPKWRNNVRLLQSPLVPCEIPRLDMRRVFGGMLVQQADDLLIDSGSWKVATGGAINEAIHRELEFAWNMVRFVKSNAIVLAQDCALCGVGAGQMSRVDSVRIAVEKAGDRAAGSVLASDAFFPFPDSIEIAAAAGVRAIIQPGGSVKDPEVIAAAAAHSIPMILTGRRHFLH